MPTTLRRGELSAEEYGRWYTPAQVLAALPTSWGLNTKKRVIAKSLEDGLLRSAAGQIVRSGEPPLIYFEIPSTIWPHWACLADHDFWAAGLRIVYSDQPDYHGPEFTAHRVRFEPAGVMSLAPGEVTLPIRKLEPEEQQAKNLEGWAELLVTLKPTFELAAMNAARLQAPSADRLTAQAETIKSAANQKRRGPKPRAFWGDAMATVEASISAGKLLASSQADVERAIADWISEQGSDAGESTIRNYARVVWERVRRQGQ